MTTDPAASRAVRLGALVGATVLFAVDLVLLGLAIAFGPTGFGGDRTMTRAETFVADAGQIAGVAACVLGAVAIALALAPGTAARSHRLRWLLGAQMVATLLLVASTL